MHRIHWVRLAFHRPVLPSSRRGASASGAPIGYHGDSYIIIDLDKQTVRQRSKYRFELLQHLYSTEHRASKLSAGPAQRSDKFNIDREIQKSPHPPSLDFQWDNASPGEDY